MIHGEVTKFDNKQRLERERPLSWRKYLLMEHLFSFFNSKRKALALYYFEPHLITKYEDINGKSFPNNSYHSVSKESNFLGYYVLFSFFSLQLWINK